VTRSDGVTAIALLAILVALLLIGLVSGTIIRHTVQVAPVLAASFVVIRRPPWGRLAALPIFCFWLFIMLLIWLYLLGLASVITGDFTVAEIVLTIAIGVACVVGLRASARSSSSTRSGLWSGVAAFLVFGALQIGAMWLSLQPALATR